MDSDSQPTIRLRRVGKRVHFKRHSTLEDIRIIGDQESTQSQRHHHRERQHKDQQQQRIPKNDGTRSRIKSKGKDNVLNIDEVPPLFRCKSREDICAVIETGKGAIVDVFRGYNVLQWYCNAKSTSPGIIQELIRRGIDINALDQRTHKGRGPVIRHTALGYACQSANIKAVTTLLQNGANPRGLAKSSVLPEKDDHGNQILYPSPVQELLCQPIHGPRPGRCPWKYHLSEEDEEKDAYLDEDDPKLVPPFRTLPEIPDPLPQYGPICRFCARDFHIWEPWPDTEEEKIAARERRKSCYYSQIQRIGSRLQACVQLLINYNCSDPPVVFPECDDPHIWSGIEYLLETFWHFFHPLAICFEANPTALEEGSLPTSLDHLLPIVSQPILEPFGEICDMLIESAGYEAHGTVGATRGQDRLLRLIVDHPEFSSFRQGQYFDVDTQLEKEQLRSSSTPR